MENRNHLHEVREMKGNEKAYCKYAFKCHKE